MTEVVWYVLPELADVLRRLALAVKPGGRVCIQQCFPDTQKYGVELLRSPDEFISRYFVPAGLEVLHEWRQILPNEKVLMVIGKRKDDYARI